MPIRYVGARPQASGWGLFGDLAEAAGKGYEAYRGWKDAQAQNPISISDKDLGLQPGQTSGVPTAEDAISGLMGTMPSAGTPPLPSTVAELLTYSRRRNPNAFSYGGYGMDKPYF